MATVRCPKCGVVNADGHRRTARCRACHEAFGKCRYCRSYDFRIVDCTHQSRREVDHVVDADEVANCPDFSSLLPETQARQRATLLRTAVIASLAVSALAFLAIHFAHPRAVATPGSPLHLEVVAPDSVFKDESFDVTVTLVNAKEPTLTEVEAQVAGRGLRALSLASVDPPDSLLVSTTTAVQVGLRELPAGEPHVLTFRFTPVRTGKVSLAVSATAATLEGARVVPVESEVMP